MQTEITKKAFQLFQFTDLGLPVYKALLLRTCVHMSRQLMTAMRYEVSGQSGLQQTTLPRWLRGTMC